MVTRQQEFSAAPGSSCGRYDIDPAAKKYSQKFLYFKID